MSENNNDTKTQGKGSGVVKAIRKDIKIDNVKNIDLGIVKRLRELLQLAEDGRLEQLEFIYIERDGTFDGGVVGDFTEVMRMHSLMNHYHNVYHDSIYHIGLYGEDEDE